ncbi:hypothetical protein ACO229_06420 [Promicromonospora sp. MS192]|uniref:hypothetical protein n=1 Tax=Promicromonospora sp. MS192 TaxID=3412684 RepID=UPI003C2EDB69
MNGPEQTPGTDPNEPGRQGPDWQGPDLPEPDLPGPDPQDDPLSAPDGAPVDPSQLSLLRMLGWHPGDPLPELDDPDGVADESSGDAVPFPSSRATSGLGGAAAHTDADLLLPAEPEPVVPINWNTLGADRAEQEWWQLDAFVYWLRDDFGLTPQELPPMWHRHPELVWELSALRTSWLAGHAQDAHPGSPLMWLRDLSDTRRRLRDWVQRCGTTLTEDRPTRRTTWPGENPAPSPTPAPVTDRAADFAVFVADDLARRRQVEEQAQAEIEQVRAERVNRLRQSWRLPTPDPEDPARDVLSTGPTTGEPAPGQPPTGEPVVDEPVTEGPGTDERDRS